MQPKLKDCGPCGGSGEIGNKTCTECNGGGKVEVDPDMIPDQREGDQKGHNCSDDDI